MHRLLSVSRPPAEGIVRALYIMDCMAVEGISLGEPILRYQNWLYHYFTGVVEIQLVWEIERSHLDIVKSHQHIVKALEFVEHKGTHKYAWYQSTLGRSLMNAKGKRAKGAVRLK